jgi:hypothetical protein
MLKNIEDKIIYEWDIPTYLRKTYFLTLIPRRYPLMEKYKEFDGRILDLHDKHKGDRCFIIGMGPSLNKTDFSIIRNEKFIAVNGFYTGLNIFKIKPQYWCVADKAVFNKHYQSLLKLNTELFLTSYAGIDYLEKEQEYLKESQNRPIVLRPLGYIGTWKRISKDLTKGIYGGTVIYSCLQIAYYLGFKEVYLLGCDCDHSKGIHFDGNTGVRALREKDNFLKIFECYKIFKKAFEEDGRKIYNATVGGKLEVFERKKLEEII